MLADLYVRQADSLLPSRRDAAIASLERAVQADPTHPRAAARLKELSADAPATDTRHQGHPGQAVPACCALNNRPLAGPEPTRSPT
jgi:hypothetical protein